MQKLFLILILFIAPGCRISGSLQGLYGYYHKTAKVAPDLIQKQTLPVCCLVQSDTPVVYMVNGQEIKSCLREYENAIVYIWAPNCTASECIAPERIQAYCNTHNIELFVVAEYYDYEKMAVPYALKRPLFGVDCAYYSSNQTQKYISRFLRDLLDKEQGPDGGRFFLFNYGCLVDRSGSLEGIRL